MIYGLTHDDNGLPIVRLAKAVKVGFGYPRGAAVHVYIDNDGGWVIEEGVGKAIRRSKHATMAEAQSAYGKARKSAPERAYPAKLGYWTFQRVASNAELFPDWRAIEAHGSKPTHVPIVFSDQNPLHQKMEWWGSAELKCQGDGRNARRRCNAARTPVEQAIAAEHTARGEQWFHIEGQCGHGRCPEASGDKPLCKPHSRLTFLLAKLPSLGTVCTYDSTGYRTAAWLASPLEQVRQITGGTLAGVSMSLKMQNYRTSFAGKPSVQIGATLEMTEADMAELVRRVRRQADEFAARQMVASARQLSAPGNTEAGQPAHLTEAQEAALLTSEFYMDGGLPDDIDAEADEDAAPQRAAVTPRRKSAAAAPPDEAEMNAALKAQLEREAES